MCSFALPLRGQTDELKFSAACKSGQTLYYKITSTKPYTVDVVYELYDPKKRYIDDNSQYYKFEDNEDLLHYKNYNTAPTGNIVIPSSVKYKKKTYTVTNIDDDAFGGCSGITSITIPKSVTNIGNYAFHGCYGMTSVSIPKSVTSIGNYAFHGCSGMTSISIPKSLTNIGIGAFFDCDSLPQNIVEDIENINNEAFVRSIILCNFYLDDYETDNSKACIDAVPNDIDEDAPIAYAAVENKPEYPGGDVALMKYLADSFKYPPSAKAKGVYGRVFVKFVIDKTGAVTNVEIIRGVDPELDAEALRVVKAMPAWKPGSQRGKAVPVTYQVPINFKL